MLGHEDRLNMNLRLLAAALMLQPGTAFARNIVLSNDDGLTSNVKALYLALKAQGHDVIVSVPCSGQSGMGGAVKFMRPLGPLAADCLNGAAKAGEPGAGPVTRPGFENDFFYVDGTPVMATMYGLDVAAMRRWGKAPDLVLSGPNEGQNVGYVVLTSGTVSNAQFAATRGLPAIALSAGADTADNATLANPKSAVVARLSADLVKVLDDRAGTRAMLPPGIALNVNFPEKLEGAQWRPSRIGTYNLIQMRFSENIGASASPATVAAAKARGLALPGLPGVTVAMNGAVPGPDQQDDESVVYRKDIAVSVMQVGYDHKQPAHLWLRKHLRGFLGR
jgi:5'-nucleotidase